MANLDPAVEQQLADMSDEDFRLLTARVRPPIAPRPGAGGIAAAEKRFGKRAGRSDLSALGITSETLNKHPEQS